MIVAPGVLDHPKFLRLARRLGPGSAIVVLIRIWAHCQTDRRGEFWSGADGEYIEAVARWDGDPGQAFSALRDIGWVRQEEGGLRVHGWEDANASLIQRWRAGQKGGRPRNRPGNREETGRFADEASESESFGPESGSETGRGGGRVTGQEPGDNRAITGRGGGRVTDKSREEESRVEGALPARAREDDSPEPDASAFAEAPSLAEMLTFAASFPGEIASGTPGPIDPEWAKGWWGWRDNHATAGWSSMRDWRRAAARDWSRQWRDHRRRASSGVGQSEGSAAKMPPGIRLRELELLAADHVGNPDNTRGSLEAKQAALPEYRKLRREIRALREELRGTEHPVDP